MAKTSIQYIKEAAKKLVDSKLQRLGAAKDVYKRQGMMSARQPKISFYYSSVTLVAGSTLFKDLKTIATLGSAGVSSAKLSAMGKTQGEIRTFLQPIALDLHLSLIHI